MSDCRAATAQARLAFPFATPTPTPPLSTALGLAGKGFALVAADTRLSKGYSILSRNVSKIAQLNDTVAVATGGCWTDVSTLHKTLHTHVDMYQHDHESDMTATSLAQMLSNTLYGRRFFPYYAFNVVAGLDAAGDGMVFTYDAVGSYEKVKYAAQGAGQKLIIPLLDNLVGHRTRTDAAPELTVEEAVRIIKEAFITAGERDIYTGDSVEIVVMTPTGIQKEVFELKKD